MNNAMTPMNFLAGTEMLGSLSEGWMLDEAPHGSPERVFRARITFERPFGGMPLVHLGIAGLDASNQDSARITTRADNVSPEGFDIVLTTWLHARLWRVDVSWLAIGP
jgi:H-type lectin domain